MRYLTVDGMLSGTGIRDAVDGGYVRPGSLGVSALLAERIAEWVAQYEDAHFHQFEDNQTVVELDREGVAICQTLRSELPDAKIDYFSAAKMQKLPVPNEEDSG